MEQQNKNITNGVKDENYSNKTMFLKQWASIKKDISKFCWKCGKLNKANGHIGILCKQICKCTHCNEKSHMSRFCISNIIKESDRAHLSDGLPDQESEEDEETAQTKSANEWEDSDEESDSDEEEENLF